jgi:hypothetical protein
MSGQSVIVWDLETVPDLAGFAAAHDLVGTSDVEVREPSATGSRSTSICIGALIAHREPINGIFRLPFSDRKQGGAAIRR